MKSVLFFFFLASAYPLVAGTFISASPTQTVEDSFAKPRKAIPAPTADDYNQWRSYWWGQFAEHGDKVAAPDGSTYSQNAQKAYTFVADIYYNKKAVWALENAKILANNTAAKADSIAKVAAENRAAKQAAKPQRPKHVVPKPTTDSYDEWAAYWWGQFNTYKNRTLPPDNTYSETARQAYMAVASDFDKKGRSNSWTLWIIIGILVPVGLALGIMAMNGFI